MLDILLYLGYQSLVPHHSLLGINEHDLMSQLTDFASSIDESGSTTDDEEWVPSQPLSEDDESWTTASEDNADEDGIEVDGEDEEEERDVVKTPEGEVQSALEEETTLTAGENDA